MSYPPGPPHEGEPNPQDPYPGSGEQQPGSGQPGSGQPAYEHPSYPPPSGYAQQPDYPPQPPSGYPQQMGYGQPGYGQQPPPTSNGKAIASLITGIGALVLSFCTCGIGGLVGIVAIFLGFAGRGNIEASGGRQSGEGMALGGIITGILATVIALAAIAFFVFAIASGNTEFSTDPSDPYSNDYNF